MMATSENDFEILRCHKLSYVLSDFDLKCASKFVACQALSSQIHFTSILLFPLKPDH